MVEIFNDPTARVMYTDEVKDKGKPGYDNWKLIVRVFEADWCNTAKTFTSEEFKNAFNELTPI